MMRGEAFNSMDDQNALAAAKFISDLGLQLIMAAPTADSGKLRAFTHTIYELDRWDDFLEFHREEITEKAHAMLKGDMTALNKSEEQTSELQTHIHTSYADIFMKKKHKTQYTSNNQ